MRKRALIVSLHDVHPGSWSRVRTQREFLAAWGVSEVSWLCVPEFHHEHRWAEHPELATILKEHQQQGDELVLHGYYHDRQGLGGPRDARDAFWTRFYTSSEAEFYDLSAEECERRLKAGLALFDQFGWRARGFIAPGWLMSPAVVPQLVKHGFLYTNTVRQLDRLQSPQWHEPAQSLCYSTRAGWRRGCSLVWNAALSAWLRQGECIRLSLHPDDFLFDLLRGQIEGIVKQALAAGYTPMSYARYCED